MNETGLPDQRAMRQIDHVPMEDWALPGDPFQLAAVSIHAADWPALLPPESRQSLARAVDPVAQARAGASAWPMTRWLPRQGSRSLGALLFAHPRFARGSLEACRLDSRHPLFRPAVDALRLADAQPAALWARRSSFSFGHQSLLVTEVFSPAIAGLRSTHTA